MESLVIDYNNNNNSLLEELKNNLIMPNYLKIKTYKEYLLKEKQLYYPDAMLEVIAREHLNLKFTEEQLTDIREKFNKNQEKIQKENEINN